MHSQRQEWFSGWVMKNSRNSSSKMNLKSRLTTIDSWWTFASWPILGPASNRKTRIWRSVKYRTNELGFIWVIIYDWILDSLHDLTLDDIYVSMFGRYQKRNVPLNFFEMESFEPYLYYWDDLFFQWCFNKKTYSVFSSSISMQIIWINHS